MNPGNSEFMSDAESREILEGDKNDIEETLEERKPGKYALKSLIRAEKRGDNREEVLEVLNECLKSEKVLDQLNNLSQQLSETENLLKRIDTDGDTKSLETGEIADKTVKELRKFLKNNKIPQKRLEELFEIEESNKNRKTAKKYIKKEIESADSDFGLASLQEDISELESGLSSFKIEIEENRENFSLPDTESSNKINDSEGGYRKKDLIEITNSVIEKLRNQGNLRSNEKLKELVNDAFLELEAENYSAFKDKLHEIENLEENDSEDSPNDLFEQENKLERIESMVSELEERQEKILGAPKTATEEVNEQLDTLEEMSGEEIKRPGTEREEKIEEIASKGFDKENLKSRSDSDLAKLEDSSESMEKIESKFESLDSEKSSTADKTSEIEENIEKLEESLNSDNKDSRSSLGKFEKKIKKSKNSEKRVNWA